MSFAALFPGKNKRLSMEPRSTGAAVAQNNSIFIFMSDILAEASIRRHAQAPPNSHLSPVSWAGFTAV
jgi:hypothetical protein